MVDIIARLGGARSSLAFKAPCRVRTSANITLSGFQTIDGEVLAATDTNLRVAVMSQSNSINNGIYVAAATAWERAKDFDGSDDVVKGTRLFVANGSVYANTEWVVSAVDPITVGSSALTFERVDDDILSANETNTLSVGYTITPYNAGTKASGTYTPSIASGAMQYATNGGAHTLSPPSDSGTIIILYTNSASAGTITTSAFTAVTGDNLTTTNGDKFFMFVTIMNSISHLHVQALQ